jgi:hypothetical protein
MAAAESKYPTLVDVATRTDADGKISAVAELLNETNEVLDDAMFLEANDGSAHKTTVRSGLPTATWRQLNYGVQPSKSTTVQIKDACGMLEAYAEVDKALADLNGNSASFRMSEDRAFIESMNQGFVDSLIYGNTAVNPERFMGLAPRYSSLSAENGGNILSGSGAGSDNTSIWLVVWGANTIHGIYPKGSKGGLQHSDKGQVTVENAGGVSGARMEAYRTHYKWDCGLTLRDWRYVVRIANIDVSDLTKTGSSGADLIDLMVQALELVPNLGMGRPVFYCNRTVRSFLRRQTLNKSNVHLNLDQVAGKRVLDFDGVPVKRCDAILNTEATVA